jgi:hypothetical protein
MDELNVLADRLRSACQHALEAQINWAESILEVAVIMWEARERFASNQEFGHWLVENELDLYSRDDRAALIEMGEQQEISRRVLLETESVSVRLIRDEVSRRVRSVAKTPAKATSTENAVNPSQNAAGNSESSKKGGDSSSLKSGPKPKMVNMPRNQEVWGMFTDRNIWAALRDNIKGSAGKEIWELILLAIDQGFIRPSNVTSKLLNAKLLFTGVSIGTELSHWNLATPKHRKHVQEIIMPAAIANKQAILAEPHKVMEIVDKYLQQQDEERQQEKKAKEVQVAVAQMLPGQQQIVTYGETMWPASVNGSSYDYDQIRAACWHFRSIQNLLVNSPQNSSVQSEALLIRDSLKWISEYATHLGKQEKMSRIFKLVRAISFSLEKNAKGECKWPHHPHGNEEGKW